jgi:hypothetical protein
MALKNAILIAINWTKTRGPRFAANWNNAECCPGCCHAKPSEWSSYANCQIKWGPGARYYDSTGKKLYGPVCTPLSHIITKCLFTSMSVCRLSLHLPSFAPSVLFPPSLVLLLFRFCANHRSPWNKWTVKLFVYKASEDKFWHSVKSERVRRNLALCSPVEQ